MPYLRPIAGAILLIFVLLPLLPASAQQPAPQQPGGEIDRNLEALIETIENEQKREELLGQLRLLLQAQRAERVERERPLDIGGQFVDALSARMARLSGQMLETAELLADLPRVGTWVERQVVTADARRIWIDSAIAFILALAGGLLAGWVVRRVLNMPRQRLIRDRVDSSIGRISTAIVVLLFDMLPVLAFATAAWLAPGLLTLSPRAHAAVIAGAMAIAGYMAVAVFARAILAPRHGLRRPLPMGDEAAAYLMVWVGRFSLFAFLGLGLWQISARLGLPDGGLFLISKVFGLMIAGLTIVFIMQNRQVVRDALAGRGASRLAGFDRRLADVWHIFAILYVVAMYLVWLIEWAGGFAFLLRATVLSLLIVAVAIVLTQLAERLIARALKVGTADPTLGPALERRVNRYLPILTTIVRATIAVVAVLAILDAWGMGLFALLGTEAGRRIVSTVIHIGIVLIGAFIVWELVNRWVERHLTETDAEGNRIERSQRARTLLPLARNALMILLVVMTTLILLSELGVNITPLLAGAGVIGLAIGFGSQKLVQDVITGAFMLIEDSVQVGDVATAGGHTGLVEGITIRTIRLRDLDGAVHVVPFSDVSTVVNLTKDFSYRLFEVGVAYREDTDYVVEVLQELGEEMRRDPIHGPDILEPLEVLGVDRFIDSAVVIRVRFKTKPMKQWGIGREFNRRMKKRFDELGIEIPFPHRTLYFGQARDGSAPAAPIRMVEEPMVPPTKGKPKGKRKERAGESTSEDKAKETDSG